MLILAVKKLVGPTQTVELRHVDLMKTPSVIDFCEKVKTAESRLDILVCNAALATGNYSTSADDVESTYVSLHALSRQFAN
jgi:NADP-dependent 3-hydroxy acid dehydrogenase YdfG